MKTLSIIVLIVVIAAGGWWLLKDVPMEDAVTEGDSMMEDTTEGEDAMMEKDGDSMMKDDGAVMEGDVTTEKGSYEAYAPEKLAKAEAGDVVLFFRASWCPTCRALDANIRSNLGSIPAGVTILDVNYDDSTALKQKYGVTYQHTLVQVDAQGNLLSKWMGSGTLADLVARIK